MGASLYNLYLHGGAGGGGGGGGGGPYMFYFRGSANLGYSVLYTIYTPNIKNCSYILLVTFIYFTVFYLCFMHHSSFCPRQQSWCRILNFVCMNCVGQSLSKGGGIGWI